MDNLAFICLDHHDWYDTVPSQGKRLTITEVKRFRSELYAALLRVDKDTLSAVESIGQGPPPSPSQEGEDHWAQRRQLELHVIANVASGRAPTMMPISKDPEISRLRFLKDEVGSKRLVARAHELAPNMNTQVTIDEFQKFAQRPGQQQWVLDFSNRWRLRHGPNDRAYLSDKDTELTHALLMMVLRSAWGRWYRLQVGVADDKALTDPSTLHVAAHLICDAAMNGRLEIRGRAASQISYEPISPEVWRLAALSIVPDPATIWRVKIEPRHGVAQGRLERVMSFDSVVVDSEAFQVLWPSEPGNSDGVR